jgi:hypothetical protein
VSGFAVCFGVTVILATIRCSIAFFVPVCGFLSVVFVDREVSGGEFGGKLISLLGDSRQG